jgi:transcriptional regulator with XRE-family HTH domain
VDNPVEDVHDLGRKQPERGSRIRVTRLLFKLQQIPEPNYVIAASMGIHPTTLSNYARGRKPISPKHLEQICRTFECEPEDVMGMIEVELAS